MKYKITPTEEGITQGKVELILETLRLANFARSINPGCYERPVEVSEN